MAISFAEFLGQRKSTLGPCACRACGVPLQESVTGNRPTSDGNAFCSDCYFEEFGKELDNFPVAMPRAGRRS